MSVFRLLDGLCRTVVGVAIVVMVVSIFGQVFYRAVLDDYLSWAEETARFSFVWLVFLGSATAFRERRHLAIDFLPEFLGARGRIVLDAALCLVAFALMIVLVRYGYQLTLRTMTQSAPATGITMGYIYIAIPISAALIGSYAIVDFVRNIMALRSGDLSRAAIQSQASILAREEGGA